MTSPRVFLVAAAFGAFPGTAAAVQHAVPSPDSAYATYCQAWNTADRGARERLIAQAWAPDGVYIDPEPTVAKGRRALGDAIAVFRHNYPGGHFRCGVPQVHHGAMRAAWVLLRPDGTQWAQGTDFGEFATDGRIQRIVGFFGPPPTVTP